MTRLLLENKYQMEMLKGHHLSLSTSDGKFHQRPDEFNKNSSIFISQWYPFNLLSCMLIIVATVLGSKQNLIRSQQNGWTAVKCQPKNGHFHQFSINPNKVFAWIIIIIKKSNDFTFSFLSNSCIKKCSVIFTVRCKAMHQSLSTRKMMTGGVYIYVIFS